MGKWRWCGTSPRSRSPLGSLLDNKHPDLIKGHQGTVTGDAEKETSSWKREELPESAGAEEQDCWGPETERLELENVKSTLEQQVAKMVKQLEANANELPTVAFEAVTLRILAEEAVLSRSVGPGRCSHVKTCNKMVSAEMDYQEACVDTLGLTDMLGLQKGFLRGAVDCLMKDWVSHGTDAKVLCTTEAVIMATADLATQQTSTVRDWGELEEKAVTADRNQAEILELQMQLAEYWQELEVMCSSWERLIVQAVKRPGNRSVCCCPGS
ncbi:unnamed protein product [Caretta caretta]